MFELNNSPIKLSHMPSPSSMMTSRMVTWVRDPFLMPRYQSRRPFCLRCPTDNYGSDLWSQSSSSLINPMAHRLDIPHPTTPLDNSIQMSLFSASSVSSPSFVCGPYLSSIIRSLGCLYDYHTFDAKNFLDYGE